MGGALDERELPLARQLAEKDWDHVVVLADAEAAGVMAVSYTHLDVYKRQRLPLQNTTS